MIWFNTAVQVITALVCGWMGWLLISLWWLKDGTYWIGIGFCLIAVLNIISQLMFVARTYVLQRGFMK